MPPVVANRQQIDDFVTWATLGIILGGRLGYVLFYRPDYYLFHPLEILAVWQGGMSFHGGALGVIVAVFLFCRQQKLDPLAFGDRVAAVVPIGLCFGRLANFINGELWGRVTDVPWGMVFPTGGPEPRHPEPALPGRAGGVVLFVLLQVLVRIPSIRARRGFVAGAFLAGYGVARGIGELFRQPDAYLGFLFAGATMGQLLSRADGAGRRLADAAGEAGAGGRRLTGPASTGPSASTPSWRGPPRPITPARDPFGAAGDFTTAPEISQAFGECLGLWAAVTWQLMGRPAPVLLVELGPGRGTLMADALRAIAEMMPAFRAAARGASGRDLARAARRPGRGWCRMPPGTTGSRRCRPAPPSSWPTSSSTPCRSASSSAAAAPGRSASSRPGSWRELPAEAAPPLPEAAPEGAVLEHGAAAPASPWPGRRLAARAAPRCWHRLRPGRGRLRRQPAGHGGASAGPTRWPPPAASTSPPMSPSPPWPRRRGRPAPRRMARCRWASSCSASG